MWCEHRVDSTSMPQVQETPALLLLVPSHSTRPGG